MAWNPYKGERYLDFHEMTAWCRQSAEANPEWVTMEAVGRSRYDKPLWLMTIGAVSGSPREERPGFWLDGGTHASEFTGVMSAISAISGWIEAIRAGDEATRRWFSEHTAYVMPCISPDGFQAMCEGHPFMRSTLRPPATGTVRVGLDPQDLDGDGAVRWMRWKHPAGAFVQDEQVPLYMRPRQLDDDPDDAWFVASEGLFLSWDGVRWVQASRKHGLDLNRNFPGSWAPFSMFGMDGGSFPLSEPESRATVEAFTARPHIAAAVSNHTYTGCLLTQPYRGDTPLGKGDIDLMETLAKDAVEGTGYDAFKVHPEFTYDPKKPTIGVWSDTLSTTFGVPGFTLELWSPLRHAGLELKNPLNFLMKPEPALMRALLRHFSQDPALHREWKPFDHPQLGQVEIGGLEYLRTVRNPPEALLAEECQKGNTIIDRVRRSIPRIEVDCRVKSLGEGLWQVEVVLENLGFLPTSGLQHGESIGASPLVSVSLSGEEVEILEGQAAHSMSHLDGWGQSRVGGGRNVIYPSLPGRGHRGRTQWILRAQGQVQIDWIAGRAGRGSLSVELA